MRHHPLSCLALALLLAGCAAPPLKLYTLGAPAVAVAAEGSMASAPTLEVRRVALPDYLDTQDIVTRQGSQIDRSATGRWASRLSLSVTDLITARLGAQHPGWFVTDQPVSVPAGLRLFVNISRLDVSADGTASLAADWTIVPHSERQATLRDRASFAVQGPVRTDADVVALTNALLDQLSDRIGADLSRAALPGR
jgi:hypothetical protein